MLLLDGDSGAKREEGSRPREGQIAPPPPGRHRLAHTVRPQVFPQLFGKVVAAIIGRLRLVEVFAANMLHRCHGRPLKDASPGDLDYLSRKGRTGLMFESCTSSCHWYISVQTASVWTFGRGVAVLYVCRCNWGLTTRQTAGDVPEAQGGKGYGGSVLRVAVQTSAVAGGCIFAGNHDTSTYIQTCRKAVHKMLSVRRC